MLHLFLPGIFSPLFPLASPGKELRLAMPNNRELRYLDELICQLDHKKRKARLTCIAPINSVMTVIRLSRAFIKV